jgi:DNA-binding transcriptional regulator LsrR (DeoR family)
MFGVGRVDEQAPLLIDGFVTADEWREMVRLGAAGELTSRSFDKSGAIIEGSIASRLTAMELRRNPARPTILVASGDGKTEALRAALNGGFATGVIIDEDIAEGLLRAAR